MPKLLLFAPCEKVLVDEASKAISLIVILQEVHYKLPPGTTLPPNAAIPMNWSVISLWQQEQPADFGVEFEQRLVVENSAGATVMANESKWTFAADRNHRIVANVPVIPLGSRKLTLKLLYRVAGSRDWLPAAEFPIELHQDVL
jgi:hypothetical protein